MENIKVRSEINDKYKWDLSKIYKDNKEIDKDIELVNKYTDQVVEYKDHLLDNSNNLYIATSTYFKTMRIMEKLIVYANMKLHEDMDIAVNQAFVGKIDKLIDTLSERLAFYHPELLKKDFSLIEKYIDENNDLKEYTFFFEESFREKEHILPVEQEEMLARLGEVFSNPSDTFEMLDTVDLKFDPININGEKIELNNSNYSKYLKDEDRNIRSEAFHNLYKGYINHKNTFASTLKGSVKADWFIANTRGYKSPLDMSLYDENIDIKLYDNLINKVNNRLDIVYEYIKLRKDVLKLDELHMYDLYVPLVKDIDSKYSYEEAIEIVKDALKPLGDNYINDLSNLIDEHIIDVYNNKNKRSGAYSWGSYDTNPYVLLNYENTLGDVFTLAHELGHSMHTYYSNKYRNYQDSSYSIFLAEIASTVNEILLNKYFYEKSSKKEEKLYFLGNLLESFRTTLIRQTMFAEFERIIYETEKKEVLTEELISSIYYDLNKKYYGNDVVSDEEIRLEWARVSHFYNSFYVYKYATGIACACKIVTDILENKKDSLDNYLEFLSSGGYTYPLEILKKVGIDIVNDDTIDKALDMFKETIDKFNETLSS